MLVIANDHMHVDSTENDTFPHASLMAPSTSVLT